jgi:LysM repeat protein
MDDFLTEYQIAESIVYTVRNGETLWTVANRRFDVPLWLLMACNGVSDPNRMNPGQTVLIPVVRRLESGSGRTAEVGN